MQRYKKKLKYWLSSWKDDNHIHLIQQGNHICEVYSNSRKYMIMIKDSNAISYKNILKGENMIIPFLSLSNTYAHILGFSWGLGSWKSRNFNIQCMWYQYPRKFCWKSELYKPKPFFLNQLFSESQFGFEVMLIILGHNLFWGKHTQT